MSTVVTLETDWRRQLERRMQSLELRDAVDEVHSANVETRLAAIEDTLKWLVRLVLGGLVLGLVAYVLNGGLVLP